MFSDLTHQQQGFPWSVSPQANSSFLEGTGLLPRQQYGCGLVGYEWDRAFANGATPKGLQVLGASHTVNNTKKADTSNHDLLYRSLRCDGLCYRVHLLDPCARQLPIPDGQIV